MAHVHVERVEGAELHVLAALRVAARDADLARRRVEGRLVAHGDELERQPQAHALARRRLAVVRGRDAVAVLQQLEDGPRVLGRLRVEHDAARQVLLEPALQAHFLKKARAGREGGSKPSPLVAV